MSNSGKLKSSEDGSVKKRKKKSKRRKGSLTLKLLTVVIVLCVAGIFILGFMDYNDTQNMVGIVEKDVIYDNIFINGIHVGGLTKEQAREKVEKHFIPQFEDKTITIIVKDLDQEKKYEYKFIDFKVRYDYTEAAERAYMYAREGFLKERYQKILSLTNTPYHVNYTALYSYDDSSVMEIMEGIQKEYYIEPVNAELSRSNGKFSVTQEKEGKKLEIEAMAMKFSELLSNDTQGIVEGAVEIVKPDVTSAELTKAQSLLGTHSSSFKPGDVGRDTNLHTAASKINDVVVYPGEIFSTNEHFGPSTYENGYRPAPVIVGGKLVQDMGGGVCQVSSALYNALLYSELEIVERQNHSLKVGYQDYGFDATLAGDYIDLKFKNNTDYPVFIESFIQDKNKVVVNIYGYEIHHPSRRLEFANALVETVQPGAEIVKEDPSYPIGYRSVVTQAKTGYRYNVYKFIYEDGKEVEKVQVNKSYYRPVRAEVIVGTGAAAAQPAGNAVGETNIQTDSEPAANNTDSTALTAPPVVEQGPIMP